MDVQMVEIDPVTPNPPLADYNIFELNEQNVEASLRRLPEEVLIDDPQALYVQSSYYDAATQKFTAFKTHQSADDLLTWLNVSKAASVRFLSIPQQFSKSPLQITRPLLRHLILGLSIDLAFLDTLAAFGDKPRISESGYDCFNATEDLDGSYACGYLHRFLDRDDLDDDYQFRQIGIYHKHDKKFNSHTFIFLQPHEDSWFDRRLQMACRQPGSAAEILSDPCRVHEILLETYFDNWRWYVKEVAQEFQDDSDRFFTTDIHKGIFRINYEKLQSWRDLADRSLPLPGFFAAEERIRDNLLPFSSPATCNRLNRQLHHLNALKTSTSILLSRINNVISLLSDTIDIRNQMESATVNGHLYNLTKDTVDDSASVRIITLMTLLYLPGSFVATLFGMNLFDFDERSRNIVVGRDFWIYFVVIVPLTLITAGGAWLWKRLNDVKRGRKKKEDGTVMLGVR